MLKYKDYQKSAKFLERKLKGFQPEILIILGSGLGFLGDFVENPLTISYKDIPNFKKSTAPGHQGCLLFGSLKGKNVAVMQGRFHYYEGYEPDEIAFPVRVLRLLGTQKLLVMNACGCINASWDAGDIMMITDHIQLFGSNPLKGQNIEEFGPRFPDMTSAYSPEYQELVRATAKENNIKLREGVYFCYPGPQFETPAEIRAFRVLGADAVGMSTVPEVITARHCGCKVVGISLLTNMGAGIMMIPLSEEEILVKAKESEPVLSSLILNLIPKL